MIRDIMFSNLILEQLICREKISQEEILNNIIKIHARSPFFTKNKIKLKIQQMIDEGIVLEQKSHIIFLILNPKFREEIESIITSQKELLRKIEEELK